MSAKFSSLVILAALTGACTTSTSSDVEAQARIVEDAPASSVATDKSSYVGGEIIDVSWTGLPGNATDWVALAPSGSDLTNVLKWQYTGGDVSGDALFPGVTANGTYVARAFSADTYELVAESSEFSIGASGATVAAGSDTYAVSSPIDITWTGLPGGATDWIALAPAGSDNQNVIRYVYTAGAVAGNTTFTGLASGDYVVRAFANDTYTLLAQDTFSVGAGAAATVTLGRATYGVGEQIDVTWSGLTTNVTDWIAIAPQGSGDTTVTRWAYTGGAASGTLSFEGPAGGGAYVARAFVNDSYTKAGESGAFTVGGGLETNQTAYDLNQSITVTWSNLTTNQHDWIALAADGSSNSSVIAWVYTNGASSGSHTFAGLASNGTYVARAFTNDSYNLLFESAPFSVGAGNGAAVVTTDAATYTSGESILASWSNLPVNAMNWVALAPAGSPYDNTPLWQYTGATASGTTTFSTSLAPGSYVIRVFFNDSYTLLDESPAFDVQ